VRPKLQKNKNRPEFGLLMSFKNQKSEQFINLSSRFACKASPFPGITTNGVTEITQVSEGPFF